MIPDSTPKLTSSIESNLSSSELRSLNEILSVRGSIGILIDTAKPRLSFNLALTIISSDELVLERLIELSEHLLHGAYAKWRIEKRLLKLHARGPRRKTVQWRNKNALRVLEISNIRSSAAELRIAKEFVDAKYPTDPTLDTSIWQQMLYLALQALHGTVLHSKLERGEFDPRIEFAKLASFGENFNKQLSKILGFKIDWVELARISQDNRSRVASLRKDI